MVLSPQCHSAQTPLGLTPHFQHLTFNRPPRLIDTLNVAALLECTAPHTTLYRLLSSLRSLALESPPLFVGTRHYLVCKHSTFIASFHPYDVQCRPTGAFLAMRLQGRRPGASQTASSFRGYTVHISTIVFSVSTTRLFLCNRCDGPGSTVTIHLRERLRWCFKGRRPSVEALKATATYVSMCSYKPFVSYVFSYKLRSATRGTVYSY